MSRADSSRQHSLRKPSEFKKVFKNPLVSTDHCFKVLARTNNKSYPRLGMAVSRQLDKRAVVRNRIKRVIRESFRDWRATDCPNLDIVVLPRRETATICNSRLFRSLQGHWSRLEKRLEG